MAIDKIKILKIETSDNGTQEDAPYYTEADPSEDYVAIKGVAFENSSNHLIKIKDNEIAIKDTINNEKKITQIEMISRALVIGNSQSETIASDDKWISPKVTVSGTGVLTVSGGLKVDW